MNCLLIIYIRSILFMTSAIMSSGPIGTIGRPCVGISISRRVATCFLQLIWRRLQRVSRWLGVLMAWGTALRGASHSAAGRAWCRACNGRCWRLATAHRSHSFPQVVEILQPYHDNMYHDMYHDDMAHSPWVCSAD